MSTGVHPPTCPQVVQIDVHTGVGRTPLPLPNVLLGCRRALICQCPALALVRTHVRSGDARRAPGFPPGGAMRARLHADGGVSVAVADEFSRPDPTAAAYDRQPPQDVAAEQSVLGGM